MAFLMVNIEDNFTNSTLSAVKSDVSTDQQPTLTDVGSSKFISVQLPQGIQLNDLHNTYKKNKRRGNDLNAYFVGHLVQRNLYRRKPINTFVPMNSGVLRNMFGGGYSKYIKALITEGIIEEYSRPTEITLSDGTVWKHNGTFSISNGISKQYRLTHSAETPLVDYKIKDKALIRKINSARIKKLEHLIKNNVTARKVYESLKKITIDTDSAIAYIKDKYHYNKQIELARGFMARKGYGAKELKSFINEILNASTIPKRKKVLEKYGIDLTLTDEALELVKLYAKFQSRLRWIKVITAIQNGKHSLISMSLDKYSGRIYHTFTLTARDIRQFIKLDNERLIEFDGGNCQWMLFIKLCNILCKPSFYSKTIEDYGIKDEKRTQQDTTQEAVYLSMLHNFFDAHKKEIGAEATKLTTYLDTNKLRGIIVEAEKRRGVTITEAQAKKHLIGNVLFGNPNDKGYNRYKSVQAFKEEFPVLSDVIRKLKTYWIDESVYGYKAKDIYGRSLKYKAFPRLLQKMESNIFVKGMENTECSFLTLHDAIVTNSKGAVEVKKTLDRIIEKDGSNIKLKYKEYANSI